MVMGSGGGDYGCFYWYCLYCVGVGGGVVGELI